MNETGFPPLVGEAALRECAFHHRVAVHISASARQRLQPCISLYPKSDPSMLLGVFASAKEAQEFLEGRSNG